MKALSILVYLLLPCSLLAGQANTPTLPKGAYVVEQRPLSVAGYPKRELVLWMLHPTRHPSTFSYGQGDRYTCPEMTRGSFLSGPLRVSLINAEDSSVLNTIEVKDYQGNDSFDIPFAILKNPFYRTTAESESKESKPMVMSLRDYVGSDKPLQFPLFQALFCMGLQTTLIGYEPSDDRVQQYETVLHVSEPGRTHTDTMKWVDYLLSEKPVEPGRWKYQIDYRGRCGYLDSYDIHFVPITRRFEGTLERSAPSVGCK
jgi:hypothetical protein